MTGGSFRKLSTGVTFAHLRPELLTASRIGYSPLVVPGAEYSFRCLVGHSEAMGGPRPLSKNSGVRILLTCFMMKTPCDCKLL